MKKLHAEYRIANQCGLTLVELLVAMTIGFFLTAGLLQLYSSNRQSYRTTESLSRIQEQGRFVLDYLASEIRPAGGKGICVKPVNNLLDDTDPSIYTADRFDLTRFVRGWNGEHGDDPDVDEDAMANYVEDTDVIMVKHAATPVDLTANPRPSSLSTPTAFTVDKETNLHKSIVIIADPFGCDMFQNSALSNEPKLSAVKLSGLSPNNISTAIFSQEYQENMEILLFHSRLYFIATDDENVPVLWERRFDRGEYEDMPLLDRVYDMQITYGLDTNLDGRVDSYSATPANWAHVAAVRIELVLGSAENNLVDAPMALPINSTIFPGVAPDRRLYQTFTTTIALRNRIL